ncbi:MAG TPA: carboxypeptidase regulatory-like domain-containing protein [Dyella sp.]|uniref:TonB-dependent receptor n=1 Tax=Dyella sp. TaxID=1869338 RepID=UPI002F9585E2
MSMKYAHFARKKIVLSVALALGVYAGGAMAQSTVGSAYGTADAGAQVQLTNLGSGQVRTVTADNQGRFRASALNPGDYRVTYTQKGQQVTRDITVGAGTGFNLDAASAAVAASSANTTQLGSITVQANSVPAIDVASVQTTTTFTADQLKELPIARNVTAVALLAPGVTKGDSAFGNLASFSGSSVAENSYYVNGFNVTNQFDSLSFAQVPYEAIDQINIQDGGFGPEYGNSTGGVTSVQTKRGTNEWKGGIDDTWNPSSLQATLPTIYNKNGTISQINSGSRNFAIGNSNTGGPVDFTNRWSAWLGGPLIKDKLFIFGLVSQTKTDYQDYAGYIPNGGTNGGGFQSAQEKDPYWLLKMDWNINESNILELTAFNDTRHTDFDIYNYGFDSNNNPYHFDQQGVFREKSGGQTGILKYTSYLTDDFTLTAQYGKSKNKRINTAIAANGVVESFDGNLANAASAPGCPVIVDARTPVKNGEVAPIQSCAFVPGGQINSDNGQDSRSSGRLDLEWKLGDHDLTFGYTRDVTSSNTGTTFEGGAVYTYSSLPNTDSVDPADNFVTQEVFGTGARVSIIQRAQYAQDLWHISDNFIARIGVRNDQFNNKNGLGQSYVRQGNNIQPRLGFAWDVHGDSSLKIYGSAGDYSLPIDAGVALRGASASIFKEQQFFYTSIDPTTGLPLGLTPRGDAFYANGETGVTPNAESVATQNLKPFKQREFILGAQQQLAGWTLGAKAIYRKVLTGLDDLCDFRPIAAYANAHYGMNFDPTDLSPPSDNLSLPGCYIANPGSGISLQLPLVAGSNQLYPVKLSASDIGEPKYKRDYYALQLTAEKNFDDKFYLNVSYVWAKSWGNSEGLVDSNIGQADTGTSELFDYPEIMAGANGNQPNDRRHTVKVFGSWNINNEWALGANFIFQTGRPENCYGDAPIDNEIFGYGQNGGSPYLYCTDASGANGHVAPRGSIGTTPNYWQLDLNGQYKPSWAKGLTFRATVFNVFNKHQVLTVNENQNASYNSDPTLGPIGPVTFNNSTYLIPTSFQNPRYVQLNAEYDFSL